MFQRVGPKFVFFVFFFCPRAFFRKESVASPPKLLLGWQTVFILASLQMCIDCFYTGQSPDVQNPKSNGGFNGSWRVWMGSGLGCVG